MSLRKLTAATVPAVVAIALAAGTAHADPAAPAVHYRTELVGNVVQTTLDGGFFQVSGDDRTVDIKAANGSTLVTLPLSFRDGNLAYPLPHQVGAGGHQLNLTAVKNVAAATPVQARPVASPMEDQRALNAFASEFGIATAVGGFIGTALGALVGLTGIVSGPGVVASVIAGAAIGGIIGTVVAGGPTLIVAGIDLINAVMAPPGTTRWADDH